MIMIIDNVRVRRTLHDFSCLHFSPQTTARLIQSVSEHLSDAYLRQLVCIYYCMYFSIHLAKHTINTPSCFCWAKPIQEGHCLKQAGMSSENVTLCLAFQSLQHLPLSRVEFVATMWPILESLQNWHVKKNTE